MRSSEVRNWLGKYFLIITAAIGGYILLFGETPLLPMARSEATGVFQIVLPVLLGQLTIIFRWFTETKDPEQEDSVVAVPAWIIKWPPWIVVCLIVLSAIQMALGNLWGNRVWTLSPTIFRNIVTFCVSILNATTVFVVSKYFAGVKSGKQDLGAREAQGE